MLRRHSTLESGSEQNLETESVPRLPGVCGREPKGGGSGHRPAPGPGRPASPAALPGARPAPNCWPPGHPGRCRAGRLPGGGGVMATAEVRPPEHGGGGVLHTNTCIRAHTNGLQLKCKRGGSINLGTVNHQTKEPRGGECTSNPPRWFFLKKIISCFDLGVRGDLGGGVGHPATMAQNE